MITARTIVAPELAREAEDLIVALAPELGASPVYVAGLPESYQPLGWQTRAFTMPEDTDYALRDLLISEGRWRGPGVGIVVCVPMMRDELLGVALHEAAHNLPYRLIADTDDDAPPAQKEIQRQAVASVLNPADCTPPTMPESYECHGLKFVRRCLHLHHRAWAQGREIGLPAMFFAGPRYDLSAAWKYRRALGDEPARMATASFAEIEATAVPQPFQQLFQDDFATWARDREPAATQGERNYETD